jgi:hypothetical protein
MSKLAVFENSSGFLPCTTRQELREWLAVHYATEASCWVRVSVKPQTDTVLYLDAVEEAL